MTTEEVKQFLSSYRNCFVDIGQLREEREQIWEIVTSCGGAPSGGHSGVSDKVGKLSAKLADYDNKILAKLKKAIAKLDNIRTVIEAVPDEKLRRLLRLKYINGYTFEQIAVKLGYCDRQIYRLHNEALQVVKDVIECHIEDVI